MTIPPVSVSDPGGAAAILARTGEAARPAEAMELLLADLVERTDACAAWIEDRGGRLRASAGDPHLERQEARTRRLPLRARGEEVGVLAVQFPVGTPEPPPPVPAGIGVVAALLLDNDRLAEEARLADQAREHFLVALNHELRTPATGLVLIADLLRSAEPRLLPPEIQDWLTLAERHIERIMLVLEGLLEATAALSAPGRPDLVEPRRLAGDVLRRAEPAARRKNLRLALSYPPDLPLLQTDVHRCGRVLQHLVDNAIRFTPAGEVRVRLDRVTRAQGGGRAGALRIAVHDPGCGIPPDQLERVFEPFAQVDEGARNVECGRGAGLGLTIARRLARSLGGEVALDSAGEGAGTTATVMIPYAAP